MECLKQCKGKYVRENEENDTAHSDEIGRSVCITSFSLKIRLPI